MKEKDEGKGLYRIWICEGDAKIFREGGFCKVGEGMSVPLLGHLAGHGREREGGAFNGGSWWKCVELEF